MLLVKLSSCLCAMTIFHFNMKGRAWNTVFSFGPLTTGRTLRTFHSSPGLNIDHTGNLSAFIMSLHLSEIMLLGIALERRWHDTNLLKSWKMCCIWFLTRIKGHSWERESGLNSCMFSNVKPLHLLKRKVLLGLNRQEIKTQTWWLINSMNVGLPCCLWQLFFMSMFFHQPSGYMSISLTNLHEETSIAFFIWCLFVPSEIPHTKLC